METLGVLMKSKNSLNLKQDDSGRGSILRLFITTLAGDTIQTNDNIYTLTPVVYKALSSTSYTGKSMKNESDILMMYNIINDSNYTGIGDKSSKRKAFLTITL